MMTRRMMTARVMMTMMMTMMAKKPTTKEADGARPECVGHVDPNNPDHKDEDGNPLLLPACCAEAIPYVLPKDRKYGLDVKGRMEVCIVGNSNGMVNGWKPEQFV